MSCAFDKEKLTAFFDGELPAAEKAEVERHIAACSECLRELGELKAAVTLVKTLPAVRAPRSVAEAVKREVARPPARVLRWQQPMMWVSAAAAALFVVVNVVWFSRVESPAPVAGRHSAPELAVAKPAEDRRASNASAAEDRRASNAAPADGPETALRRAREGESVEKAAAKEELAKADGAADLKKALEAPTPARKEPFAAEPKPAAAAAPPAATPPPAPGADPKRDEGVLAQTLQEEQKNRQDAVAAQNVYVATGADSLRCQSVVEGWSARNNLQSRGRAQSRAGQGLASGGGGAKIAKGFGKDGGAPAEAMVVEVTDAELAALTKELAANGYRITPATPAQNQLGYVEAPAEPLAKAADAEKRKEGEADRALKPAAAPAPAESGAPLKQQAGRAGARRITIWFVEPPAAQEKK